MIRLNKHEEYINETYSVRALFNNSRKPIGENAYKFAVLDGENALNEAEEYYYLLQDLVQVIDSDITGVAIVKTTEFYGTNMTTEYSFIKLWDAAENKEINNCNYVAYSI